MRKELGIYFTPESLREKVMDLLQPYISQFKRVMEPSCGAGDFIADLTNILPKSTYIIGIELHSSVFKHAKQRFKNHKNVSIINQDFLKFESKIKYDLIIGNPPYVVTPGRSNLFVEFLYKCVSQHLAPNGILAFVIPSAFQNTSYYAPTRKLIIDSCEILEAKNVSAKFTDASVDVMILVVQKRQPPIPKPFVFASNYITPYWRELNAQSKNQVTLKDYGCRVDIGIEWNKYKSYLSNKPTKSTVPLIYVQNLKESTITHSSIKKQPISKPQYIERKAPPIPPFTGPAIAINRGYGNSKYNFQYAWIDIPEFYPENHVLLVQHPNREVLQKAFKSLGHPKTKMFINLFTANGALTKTELLNVVRLYSMN